MKKYIIRVVLAVFIVFVLSVTGFKIYNHSLLKTTDFEVRQWFFMHGSNFEDARINVIANINDYDLEKMMNKIRRYYEVQHGRADNLHITLFNSEEDFKEFINYEEMTFDKD